MEPQSNNWDKSFDIIVVGYGFSGAVAAITASDLGNKVLLLEKMPHFGGNSILSGGAFRIASDPAGAFQYLRRTCLNTTPSDVLEVFAKGLTEIPSFMENLKSKYGLKFITKYGHGTYKFPGGEALGEIKIAADGLENFHGYPFVQIGLTNTAQPMFRVLEHEIEKSEKIEVMLSSPVRELLTGGEDNRMVTGVVAENNGRRLRIRSRKGVVLACGGFENNEELKLQFLDLQPVYSVCSLGNTGDGILMAQKLGAKLWHTWHIHGSYGFKRPEHKVAFRHRFGGGRDMNGVRLMPWIVVDKFGKRYMNEQPIAGQDTPWRDISYYDAEIQDYPRIPSYLIFDEEGRKKGQLFVPHSNDGSFVYEWSTDNLKEIEKGWVKKSETIEKLANDIGMDSKALASTIEKWNSFCANSNDSDFNRPSKSMMAIKNPPYYAVDVYPIVTNTQGGIAHNVKQQVVDTFGNPIPRLYVTGELSSIFGHLYLQAGNNSECIVSGRLAAKYLNDEPSLDSA